MIKIGIIGYGYWGPNLARNFQECDESRVEWIADLSPKRLEQARKRYPQIRVTTDPMELIRAPNLDAVAIATPVSTHYDLALKALQAGKHVLVEKPLTQSSDQAKRLIEEAQRRDRVLMVDHTFIYRGPVRKIKELITAGDLGDVQYYDSVRINLGLFQTDVNVLWDLAVHDLAIMGHILPYEPVEVSATGISHVPGRPENTAYMTIFFRENCIAHIHVSWLSPVKQRNTLVGGSRKMVVYDDLHPSEAIKVYDHGINLSPDKESLYRMLIEYRTGEMVAPQFDRTEALRKEAQHFVDCVAGKCKPLTDGQAGLSVVRLLEAATESLKQRGRPVKV